MSSITRIKTDTTENGLHRSRSRQHASGGLHCQPRRDAAVDLQGYDPVFVNETLPGNIAHTSKMTDREAKGVRVS